ncbi:Uncharacterised protein [uncultured archaeon]|nr:Uncharacterised protein [uncultured archaeon]
MPTMKKKRAILLSSKRAGKNHTTQALSAICAEYNASLVVNYINGEWEAQATVTQGPMDNLYEAEYTETGPSLVQVIDALKKRIDRGIPDKQLQPGG